MNLRLIAKVTFYATSGWNHVEENPVWNWSAFHSSHARDVMVGHIRIGWWSLSWITSENTSWTYSLLSSVWNLMEAKVSFGLSTVWEVFPCNHWQEYFMSIKLSGNTSVRISVFLAWQAFKINSKDFAWRGLFVGGGVLQLILEEVKGLQWNENPFHFFKLL